MSYYINDNCNNCDNPKCIQVCPVDCFHKGPTRRVINPDECIECAVCVPECENNAIVTFEDPSTITNEQQAIIDFNEKMSKIWPQDVGTFV